ncbi:MAG: DUF4249 domain-containing protein [Bacteroidota bacterium]
MKKYIQYLLKPLKFGAALLLLMFSTTACEQEIDLELTESEPRLVIEGWVSTLPGPYEFRVSRSVGFLGNEPQELVSGAVIVVSDDMGNADTLEEGSPGFYYTGHLRGAQNHQYFVEVQEGGQTYKASNWMPRIGEIDSSWVTYEPDFVFGEGYYVNLQAFEPAGVGDFYQFRLWQNDSLFSAPGDLLVTDDRFVDGQLSPFLFPSPMEEGDTVVAEVRGISNLTYDYFITLFQQASGSGGPFGAPPENLLTNWDNGALGFFGCGAAQRDTLVVEP